MTINSYSTINGEIKSKVYITGLAVDGKGTFNEVLTDKIGAKTGYVSIVFTNLERDLEVVERMIEAKWDKVRGVL